jgi:Holliday junction resolvase RusA-like endonuclease
MITLDIDGEPIPWKRAGRRSISGKIIVYDRQAKEKEQTRWQLRSQYKDEPKTTALLVDITFNVKIPKSTSKKRRRQMLSGMIRPITRPDSDNFSKYIEDCMTGIIYRDDSQIVDAYLHKRYSDRPSTKIKIKEYSFNSPPEPHMEHDFNNF